MKINVLLFNYFFVTHYTTYEMTTVNMGQTHIIRVKAPFFLATSLPKTCIKINYIVRWSPMPDLSKRLSAKDFYCV